MKKEFNNVESMEMSMDFLCEMDHIIDEPEWHRRGVDLTGDDEDGLLAEDRSYGD